MECWGSSFYERMGPKYSKRKIYLKFAEKQLFQPISSDSDINRCVDNYGKSKWKRFSSFLFIRSSIVNRFRENRSLLSSDKYVSHWNQLKNRIMTTSHTDSTCVYEHHHWPIVIGLKKKRKEKRSINCACVHKFKVYHVRVAFALIFVSIFYEKNSVLMLCFSVVVAIVAQF